MGLMEYSMGKVCVNTFGVIDWTALNKDVLQSIADVGNENVIMEEQFDDALVQQLRSLI